MGSFIFLILATIVIAAIARYNESNKLFWMLFTSMMLGIAGWTLHQKTTSNDDKHYSVQKNLTQALTVTSDIYYIYMNEELLSNIKEFVPKPVDEEYTGYEKETAQCSSVGYITVLTNPPEKIPFFDTG